jgi:hypothetical protein
MRSTFGRSIPLRFPRSQQFIEIFFEAIWAGGWSDISWSAILALESALQVIFPRATEGAGGGRDYDLMLAS